jgi:hypothetical protein
MEEEQPPDELPPATGKLPERGNLPAPNKSYTKWQSIIDRDASDMYIPAIPGKKGGGYHSQHGMYPNSTPHHFIYVADLTNTAYENGDQIKIQKDRCFKVLDHNMVWFTWDTMPPTTSEQPEFKNLPKLDDSYTEWELITDREAHELEVPDIPGSRYSGFYSQHKRWPGSNERYFIYVTDQSKTAYRKGDNIGIKRGLEFEILDHNMVLVTWDTTNV